MSVDLQRYFKRINYRGPTAPTLDTLQQLHQAHTQAIAFENFDVLLGRRINIDDDTVFEKLVVAGRGGWCFEQNGLFRRVLAELGFKVTNLSARVLLSNPVALPALTHRLTLVGVNNESWIADVGFGGKTLPGPMRLTEDNVQDTSYGRYSLECKDGAWSLKYHDPEKVITLYRFTLDEQHYSDYEMGNHYVATWPESHFRHCLTLSLYQPGGRRNTLYSATENMPEFASVESLYKTIQQNFNLGFDHPQHGITLGEFSRMLQSLNLYPDSKSPAAEG